MKYLIYSTRDQSIRIKPIPSPVYCQAIYRPVAVVALETEMSTCSVRREDHLGDRLDGRREGVQGVGKELTEHNFVNMGV